MELYLKLQVLEILKDIISRLTISLSYFQSITKSHFHHHHHHDPDGRGAQLLGAGGKEGQKTTGSKHGEAVVPEEIK